MYTLTRSTPEHAVAFISQRTHAALAKAYCYLPRFQGMALHHVGSKGARFIGTLSASGIIKPGA